MKQFARPLIKDRLQPCKLQEGLNVGQVHIKVERRSNEVDLIEVKVHSVFFPLTAKYAKLQRELQRRILFFFPLQMLAACLFSSALMHKFPGHLFLRPHLHKGSGRAVERDRQTCSASAAEL